jgi:hypothetical protein
VDLAFVPEMEFRALSPSFRLVFGEAREPRHPGPPTAGDLIGLAWLHALHARSAIARGKLWQAEYMISGMRDHALALACLRHGVAPVHGRGIDALPAEVVTPFEDSLVRKLEAGELARAFSSVTRALLAEVRANDARLADGLQGALIEMISYDQV